MNSCFRSPFRPVRAVERRNRQSHGAQRHQPRRGALWQSRIGQRRLPTLPNGSGTERTKGGVAWGSVPSSKAQIAFLQGERKGQENLKKDLVRRIKMLEYALKQERYLQEVGYTDTILDVKSQRVKALLGLAGDAVERPSDKNTEPMVNGTEPSLKETIMIGYLQEVGYTDTILDVKSQRVKALLGLAGDAVERPSDKNTEPMVNGTEPSLKETIMIGKPDLTDSTSVLDTFKFLESAAAEFSDEDEDDDSDGKEKTIIDSATIVRKKVSSSPSPSQSLSSEASDDHDTEEALKEFDFLVTTDEADGSGESRSSGDGTEWGPNRSKLQDMLANLRDAEDLPSVQPSVTPPSRPSVARLNEHETNRTDEVEALTFPPTSGKSFIMGTDEAMESELGLGELAGLTVANEADSLTYDVSS
ncbi:UNVERIFIED_CONTAM: hypothetical protein FKN15_045601 [Acipenser sinensis]